jgi:hypothetical protein
MACAKWIKQHTPPQCIGDLLTHPRNDDITHTIHSSSRAVFQRTDGDIYKGITKELEAMFWEDKRLPPGMPDANRSLQMLRMETEVKNRKLEAERDKRARIRALENKKKKARELYSGGGMGGGEGSDDKLFSGGMGDSGNQMNISGAMGGDLSGNSGDLREIRIDDDDGDGCGGGGGGDMDMLKTRQELKLIDMTRVCYHRGVGPKHGSKVHADMELISEMIRAESNRLGHMGEDPPSVKDTTYTGTCGWGDTIWDDVPSSSAYTRGGISQYERGRLLCLSGIIKFLDPCAFAIFNRLVSDKIVPLQTEFSVYDEYIKMATNIDMIAWDIGNSKGIFIELKTGHNAQTDYNAHDSISFFKTDHKTLCIQDTALNRACFQLLTSLLFVAQRYSIQFDAALIVRTASASVQPNDYYGDQFGNSINNKSNRKTRAAAAHKSTRLVQLYRIPPWMIEQSCQVMMSESLRNRGISHINKMKKLPADAKKILIDEIKNAPNNTITWLPDQASARGYALWYHSTTTGAGGGGGGGGGGRVPPPSQQPLFPASPSPYKPYKEKYIYTESEIIEPEIIIIKDQDYNQARISDRRDKNPFFTPLVSSSSSSSSSCPIPPQTLSLPSKKHVSLSPNLRVKKAIKKSCKTIPLLKQTTKQQRSSSLETKKRLYLDLPPPQSSPLSKSGKGKQPHPPQQQLPIHQFLK